MSDTSPPGVVVSAGFSKTHMTTAALEVLRRGQLALAITGAYPTQRVAQMARLTRSAGRGRIARLLERGEDLPGDRMNVMTLTELLFDAAQLVGRIPRATGISQRLGVRAMRLYGDQAARALAELTPVPSVLHFRAGYGQASLTTARRLGMHVLCDHAIAHPSVLDALIASRGRRLELDGATAPLSPFDRAVLSDIDQSDSVLVNSDFVRDTFLACGWSAERVHVLYLGVDENFLRGVSQPPRRPWSDGPLRLLFAGRFERRKGADVIVEALSGLHGPPWELVIAGPVMSDIRNEHRDFFADPRVSVLGTIRRPALAQEMLTAPVFVFPSYAEGSARVVFEALACGCYVITTPNSGTIVEDGEHGALVAPGDAGALAAAISAAAADRARVAHIGADNAELVRSRYRQTDYGDGLSALYSRIVSTTRAVGASR